MDGISNVASVIALLEISAKVVILCIEYHSKVKKAAEDIKRLQSEIEVLDSILKKLRDVLLTQGTDQMLLTTSLSEPLNICSSVLQELENRLNLTKSKKAMSRYGIRALKWPFESKDIDENIEILEQQKSTFSLILNIDQT